MAQYDTVPEATVIEQAVQALKANGFAVTVVPDGKAAKDAVLSLVPKGAEVLTTTSATLDAIGVASSINESGDYDAVRPKLMALYGDSSKKREQRKLGTAPDYVIGSVHALTQDGRVLVASATGSQLPAYTYGAGRVIWVVGAQKIVKDMEQAQDRLRTHTFPLEDARSQKAYGSGSSINKEVMFDKELPGRISIIIVTEVLGF